MHSSTNPPRVLTSVSDGGLTIGTIKDVVDEISSTTVYAHTCAPDWYALQ